MKYFSAIVWFAIANIASAVFPDIKKESNIQNGAKGAVDVQKLNGQGYQEERLQSWNGASSEWNWSFESYTEVNMLPDIGVYAFQFGKAGTYAYQNFIVNTDRMLLFEVFDCFCGGDYFSIYDWGQFRANQNYFCQNSDDECSYYSKSPEYCFAGNYDDTFCYSYYYLQPGKHNLTIGVDYSPYNGGTGFARLTTVCQYQYYLDSCCYRFDDCNYKIVYKNKHHKH